MSGYSNHNPRCTLYEHTHTQAQNDRELSDYYAYLIEIALLLVLSEFDAFLSVSTTLNIADENTMVDEFRIDQDRSRYPKMAEIIMSPIYGLTSDASGASKMMSRSTFRA